MKKFICLLHYINNYGKILKAQNTHAIGVGRRVQVKLMEADVEGSRGHNKNKMEERKKCLNQ